MKSHALAVMLATGFMKDGILVLPGKTRRESYANGTVLQRLFWLLKNSSEQYAEFGYILSDFHQHQRRRRSVRIIVRRSLLARPYVEIDPDKDVQDFLFTLSEKRRRELQLFLTRQSNLLVMVSEGDDNQKVHSLLQAQLDKNKNNLEIIEVPIVNFFHTGTARQNPIQKALVYVTQ